MRREITWMMMVERNTQREAEEEREREERNNVQKAT